jgi:hypothetical protein
MTTTKLGSAMSGTGTPPTKPGKFDLAFSGARVFVPVTIPGLNLAADMTVVGHDQLVVIDGESYTSVRAAGVGEPSTYTAMTYEADRAARTLARACFDPEARAKGDLVPIGTVDQWRGLPEEWVSPLWQQYEALRAQIDPVAEPLSIDDRNTMRVAIKKKDRALLLRFAPWKLAALLLTTDDPPSS